MHKKWNRYILKWYLIMDSTKCLITMKQYVQK
nr:MAG TPA: hypothetical protein [Bacteriophage sp.]